MKNVYRLIFIVAAIIAVATAKAQERPVTVLPEGGKTTLYHRSGGAYYAILGNKYDHLEYSYRPSEMVEYDNGDVYIRDFFSQYDYTYYNNHFYIKGHKDGSAITFEFPQLVSVQTFGSNTSYFYVSMVEYSATKKTFVPVSPEKNRYTILVKDDGTIVADIQNDGLLFPGKIDHENDWVFEGEVFSTWTPMNYKVLEAPSELNVKKMSLLDVNGFGHFVDMGIIDNDVYIKGMFDMAPDAWIKGCCDGGKITFESGQYLGFSPSGAFFSFFTAAQFMEEYDEEEKENVRVLKFRDAISFDYDETAQTLSAPAEWLMVYNKNPEFIDYMEYLESPVIQYVPEDVSKELMNPWNVDHHVPAQVSETDLEYMSFCISSLNVEGKLLDTNKLYYRVFFNGQPYTFIPGKHTYPGLEEPTTFVPFDFENGGSFSAYNALRMIYIYEKDVETVGVQLYYIEGEPKEENIVSRSALVSYPAIESNKVPADPSGVSFFKATKAWEYSELSFTLSAKDSDGNELNPDNLYYLVYFDNNEEPFTFVRDKSYNYYYFDTPITYVPFAYIDYPEYGDIKVLDNNEHKITVYDRAVETAGVRLCYIEGEPNADNVVAQTGIIYPSTSSIEDALMLKTINEIEYYDLRGLSVENPENGVFVKIVRYSDGTVETVKVKK
ncbi:hypothetical protein [uncultured Muribaculum sp.]|uniref:hypothetical protein n=1 Tax=uncultured Muribaculum sp. TaxID=1918613 RepID=UPI0025E3CED1|nr:hypothetical protein [uncultured Muribaculum sp.]